MARYGDNVQRQVQRRDTDTVAVTDPVVGRVDAIVHRGMAGQGETVAQHLAPPTWSAWWCVSRMATGRMPSATACSTGPGSPGSTTRASPPGATSSQM